MSDNIILIEKFDNGEIDKRLEWFSQPENWKVDSKESKLIIKPDKQTDFWQKTHYGFQVDNGHFLAYQVEGDFRLTTKVKSKPMHKRSRTEKIDSVLIHPIFGIPIFLMASDFCRHLL